MLQTKNRSSFVSPLTYRLSQTSGFTFMEIIIAISLLGIISVIFSGFLITVISGGSKSEISKEVRQNGNFALSVIEGLVLNSVAVSCPDLVNNHLLSIKDVNGNFADIRCLGDPDYYISSSSAGTVLNLTGDNVAVNPCSFTCDHTPGKPTKVTVDFSVSQKGTSLRPNEKSTINFQTEINTRNY